MKIFKYRLQQVLELKQRIEKQQRQELAQLLNVLKNENDLLEKLNRVFANYLNQRSRLEQNRGRLADILLIDQFLQKMKVEIQHQRQVILRLEQKILIKQKQVLQAIKEKKIIKNHKEIKLAEYQKDELRTEQNFLDELVTIRRGRRASGSPF